jgi:hypothetical protein
VKPSWPGYANSASLIQHEAKTRKGYKLKNVVFEMFVWCTSPQGGEFWRCGTTWAAIHD